MKLWAIIILFGLLSVNIEAKKKKKKVIQETQTKEEEPKVIPEKKKKVAKQDVKKEKQEKKEEKIITEKGKEKEESNKKETKKKKTSSSKNKKKTSKQIIEEQLNKEGNSWWSQFFAPWGWLAWCIALPVFGIIFGRYVLPLCCAGCFAYCFPMLLNFAVSYILPRFIKFENNQSDRKNFQQWKQQRNSGKYHFHVSPTKQEKEKDDYLKKFEEKIDADLRKIEREIQQQSRSFD